MKFKTPGKKCVIINSFLLLLEYHMTDIVLNLQDFGRKIIKLHLF